MRPLKNRYFSDVKWGVGERNMGKTGRYEVVREMRGNPASIHSRLRRLVKGSRATYNHKPLDSS